MPSKAFKLAEAMVSNPVMSDMVENPTATPTQIAAVETKTATISNDGVISVSAKNITSNNTLTQSFDSNQTIDFNLTDSISSVSPLVSVFKEIPQPGVSSKGNWDVNANATNYEFYDEKPYSTYASTTLTPSATGDGTFTSSNPTETSYDFSNPTARATSTFTAPDWHGLAFNTDGTKLLSLDPGYLKLKSYSLSTAWDITTINSSAGAQSSISTADLYGATISADGTKLLGYVSANGYVYEYTMSTPFDVTTLTSNGNTNSLGGSAPSNAMNWFVKPGTYNTVYAVLNRHLYKYTFTGGSIITGTVTRDANYLNLDPANQKSYMNNGQLQFKPDGTEFYIGQGTDSIIEKWTLSTAWDITTATKSSDTAPFTTVGNIWLKPDGKRIYYIDNADSKKIKEISIGSTLAFNAADVGKKVVGNSGSAIITSTAGAYKSVTAFADTSAISSWQMFGSQGKADGSGIELSGYSSQSDIVFPTGASGSGAGMVYNNSVSPTLSSIKTAVFNNEGTIAIVLGGSKLQRYNLSTAFDLSTMNTVTSDFLTSNINANMTGMTANSDGTKVFVSDYGDDTIKQFTLSTAWSPSTASYDGYYRFNAGGSWNNYNGGGGAPSSSNFNPFSFQFNSDGTKLLTILWDNNPYHSIAEFALSTAWDMSTLSYTSYANLVGNSDPEAIVISADGLKLMMHGGGLGNTGIEVYSLPSAFSVGSAGSSLTRTSGTMDLSSLTGDTNGISYGGLSMSNDGKRMWVTQGANKIYEITGGTTSAHPYSQYFPTLTNSSNGQINSSTWQDINSMAADETKNDGDIFYAVSTDNRTSWSVAKASDGVRKIARNNSGTWQYNNNAGSSTTSGFSLSSTSYESEIKLDTGTGGWNSGWPANSVAFNNDGTKMYGVINAQNAGQNPAVYEFSLSTAYDVSTASYTTWINVQPNTGNRGLKSHVSLQFSPNGQYMYVNSSTYDYLSVYTLSTAWDISTASHTRNVATTGFSTGNGGFVTSNGIIWKGALGNVQDLTFQPINDYSLSSVGSAQYISGAFGSFNPETLVANADATKIFIHTGNTGSGSEGWVEYTRSSSGAISTSDTLTQTNVWNHGLSYDPKAGQFSVDGTKMIIATDVTGGKGARVFSTTGTILSYGTSETWVNGTTNNEHATLQQALGAQALNRMNKAQLDAVADGYHFSQDSADTLDLMIAPYAASGSSPISDGVTINYDAEALVREAVGGTDYIAEFPNASTINIKSLINGNMKIRAQ